VVEIICLVRRARFSGHRTRQLSATDAKAKSKASISANPAQKQKRPNQKHLKRILRHEASVQIKIKGTPTNAYPKIAPLKILAQKLKMRQKKDFEPLARFRPPPARRRRRRQINRKIKSTPAFA